jgi:hypothetical protein
MRTHTDEEMEGDAQKDSDSGISVGMGSKQQFVEVKLPQAAGRFFAHRWTTYPILLSATNSISNTAGTGNFWSAIKLIILEEVSVTAVMKDKY